MDISGQPLVPDLPIQPIHRTQNISFIYIFTKAQKGHLLFPFMFSAKTESVFLFQEYDLVRSWGLNETHIIRKQHLDHMLLLVTLEFWKYNMHYTQYLFRYRVQVSGTYFVVFYNLFLMSIVCPRVIYSGQLPPPPPTKKIKKRKYFEGETGKQEKKSKKNG